MIILIAIAVTKILLLVLCLGGMVSLMWQGFKLGARKVAEMQVYEQFPETHPNIPISLDQMAMADEFKKAAQDRVYRAWCVQYKLPVNADTRSLFNNADYRKTLAGKNGN